MQGSQDRILTTHAGSLPRPADVLDMMKAKAGGEPYDAAAFDGRVREAIADSVRAQVEDGIDVVADGEISKTGFFAYVQERLTGFEARPDEKHKLFAAELAAFPEYYEAYFARAMFGGLVAPMHPMFCVGPVSYTGEDVLRKDIENLKAALDGVSCEGAFIPATAPSGVGYNAYYGSDEEYFHAVAAALHTEYLAIVEAGFLLQIDDPFLSDVFCDASLDDGQKSRKADIYVEAINESLSDIPPDKVRFHTCYGINEGPRVHDAMLDDVAGHMLRINAGAYSFENGNSRHEHEYHLWETLKLPDGKALIPGVITHASNIVEHPDLIAERLVRFAKLVGRENVIAGADCGFSSQACYHTEVHPTVIRAKFQAMAEGARIATKALW